MLKNPLLPALPFFLFACHGGIDAQEAKSIFDALVIVNTDVQSEVSTATPDNSRVSAKDVSATEEEEGFAYSGTVDGGVLWSGLITIAGQVAQAEDGDLTTLNYDLSTDYDDVTTASPKITMNGELSIALDIIQSADNAFDLTTDFNGSLKTSGEVEGTAEISYDLHVIVDPASGTYTCEATGEINGHDVSDYATDLTADAF